MFKATVQRIVVDQYGDETSYTYTARAETESEAVRAACIYASMVEYGLLADKWQPSVMAFPREQLYQFIQPSQLDIIEQMYPDAVATAYQNALAYVQSYIGAMFNVDEIIANEDTTSTGMTLRLALAIQTAVFLLSSSPQYSETIELHNRQIHTLLRGLKSGNRNFGANAIISEPDVRVSIVKPTKTGSRP